MNTKDQETVQHLISWIETSTCHAYPIIHFTGSKQDCEEWRSQSNFPHTMKVCSEIPASY